MLICHSVTVTAAMPRYNTNLLGTVIRYSQDGQCKRAGHKEDAYPGATVSDPFVDPQRTFGDKISNARSHVPARVADTCYLQL